MSFSVLITMYWVTFSLQDNCLACNDPNSSLSTTSHCNDPTYQMFGSLAFDDDDDQHPLDLLAMEQSGPR